MGRSNKSKGAENQQQQVDAANSEANATGNHMEEASGEHTDDTPLSETPTATDIMFAINQLSQNVDKRFDTLQVSLADLRQTMADIEERVTSNENGLNEYESRIKALEDQCARWEDTAQSLSERLDDLVSRSRRQNIRIIGVKEGTEKGNPTDFVAKLIPKLLGEENFGNKQVKVDRAHRIRGRAAAAGGPPRQIIARIHHDPVKELILKLSSQKFPLQYEGARLYIFPDLGPAVMKQRQRFDNIRARCKAAELRCGFRYPATLVASVGSDRRLFINPKEAERFLDDNKIPRQTSAAAKGAGNS